MSVWYQRNILRYFPVAIGLGKVVTQRIIYVEVACIEIT